jgi:hypothetical protein
MSPQSVCAVDVTLAWDANTEADLAGYRIFYREDGQSYDYDYPAWEGTDSTCTIYDLNNDTTYYFVARAFDEAGNESGDSDEVSYEPSNQPPVLSAIGDRTIDERSGLIFGVIATDPDGDALTLTASNLPIGATFRDNGDGTGIFSWTPDYTQAGTYPKVTDNGSPVQSDSEQVTITVGDVNRPPALNTIGAKSVDEDSLLTFTITASDPDGDDLTYSAGNVPTGASRYISDI